MTHDSPKQAVRCVRLAIEDAPALSSLESRCFALPWTEQSFAEAFAGKTFRAFGSLLMATALQDAKETGILRGVLEVRISNAPAIHLYESFGFRQVGKRRGYYQDTGEDALIYTLDMGQTRTNP